MSWTTLGLLGAALLGGVFLYSRLSGGGAGAAPRRRRRFKLPAITLPTAALIGGAAYFYGKSTAEAAS